MHNVDTQVLHNRVCHVHNHHLDHMCNAHLDVCAHTYHTSRRDHVHNRMLVYSRDRNRRTCESSRDVCTLYANLVEIAS